jgi:hypothetical protein
MRAAQSQQLQLTKHPSCEVICIVLVFCVAAAIASPAQSLTVLVNFDETNGGTPYAGLTQTSDGSFYGTTSGGGDGNGPCSGAGPGFGTVFKMTPTGS